VPKTERLLGIYLYKPNSLNNRAGVSWENSTTAKPKQRLPFLIKNRSIAIFGDIISRDFTAVSHGK